MTVKDAIENTLSHISAKIVDLQATDHTGHRGRPIYWCGKQAATTLSDFLEGLWVDGIITTEEKETYQARLLYLYRELSKHRP